MVHVGSVPAVHPLVSGLLILYLNIADPEEIVNPASVGHATMSQKHKKAEKGDELHMYCDDDA